MRRLSAKSSGIRLKQGRIIEQKNKPAPSVRAGNKELDSTEEQMNKE